MKLTHIYRIKPSTKQIAIMETWLEMRRRHFNYALGQRLDWLRRTGCQIDRCGLVSEPLYRTFEYCCNDQHVRANSESDVISIPAAPE
jgi:hypothetical protein